MKLIGDNGSRQTTIKSFNRGLALGLIATGECRSRADISRRLGLTKTTLTNIVSELIGDNIIMETDDVQSVSQGNQGRRSVALDISDRSPVVCGMLIRRKKIELVIGDIAGRLLFRRSREVGTDLTIAALKDIVETLYREITAENTREIFAVGISAIGPLDTRSGALLKPHSFYTDHEEFHIVDFVTELTGLPVVMMNDATAGALAEHLYGRARQEANFIHLSIVHGIGAGLYLNGEIYNGEAGQNGEIGHTSINFSGPRCDCGNRGCLESYASLENMLDRAQELEPAFPDHRIFRHKNISLFDIFAWAGEGDSLSLMLLNEYCDFFAHALTNLVSILNVDTVIMSNATTDNNGIFEKILESRVNKLTGRSDSDRSRIRVISSAMGLEAPLYGSIGMVAEQIFKGQMYFWKEA